MTGCGIVKAVHIDRKSSDRVDQYCEGVVLMNEESLREVYKALINAEKTIALLNSMVLSGENHSKESELVVEKSLDSIKSVRYCFMD